MIIESRPDTISPSSSELLSHKQVSQENRMDDTLQQEENTKSKGHCSHCNGCNTHGDKVEISKEARERQAEERETRELQQRDREVRNHEQAHIVASGRIPVSGPIYTYEKGPDGRMYAVAGEVNFRLPPTQSPKEKLELAQQLRRMALAPAQPSPKDRMVAAKAAQKVSNARIEMMKERQEETDRLNVEESIQWGFSIISGQLDE